MKRTKATAKRITESLPTKAYIIKYTKMLSKLTEATLKNMRQIECLHRFHDLFKASQDDLCSTTIIGVAPIMIVLAIKSKRAYKEHIANIAPDDEFEFEFEFK